MTGETNLKTLLRQMSPVLNPGSYVFCSVGRSFVVPDSVVLASFVEQEGKTLVLSREAAENHQLKYMQVMSWITLKVHSSLEAVGFTARVSAALADEGISCNMIAGYYHDHIFVDKDEEFTAMEVLKRLSEGVSDD